MLLTRSPNVSFTVSGCVISVNYGSGSGSRVRGSFASETVASHLLTSFRRRSSKMFYNRNS